MTTNKFQGAAAGLLKFAALAWVAVLAGCGGSDQGPAIPGQKWQGLDVQVESRPNPPRAGMNEFLVLVTGERGRPAYNLVVSLRTDAHDEWKQAIEDGQIGVYRRAVEVEPGTRSVLEVELRDQGSEPGAGAVLRFQLNPVK